MKKLIFLFLISLNAFATGQLSVISPGITLYSEYYPNSKAKFKGTIIFENGSGTDLSEWKSNHRFFQCARKIGSLFLYDRNGLGSSPPDLKLSKKNPITAPLIVDKLLALLEQRKIKPPYLFVAHSYGAIYAGYFTLRYPQFVKGVFLVDPVPRNFHFSKQKMQKYNAGVNKARIRSADYIYKNYSGSEAEVFYQLLGFSESKQSVKLLGIIKNTIPVLIVSSSGMENEKPLEEDWYSSQKQWLNSNSNSKILQVNSGHFIQIDQPKIVCEQIKKFLGVIKKPL